MVNDKLKIIFVDDERNILKGIRRMLHSQRGEWVMTFACGADEALEQIKANPFDLIISDMKMGLPC